MNSPLDEVTLDDLVKIRDILAAESSLYEFLRQAWCSIEGDLPFTGGWHIGAIAEHLEAVASRQIRNLIINIPPRCCKSSLVSVAFPAWVWLSNPSEQFLYASHGLSLSLRDSVKCRRLILSPWYQTRWGDRYQLVGDQNTKGRFDNTKRGHRISTSAGSSITGEGGSILVCDDINIPTSESESTRESKIDWWAQVWSTRLNNRNTDCKVVIQQRIHERDISGYLMDHDEHGDWTRLILPMKFSEKRCSVTVVLPSSAPEKWQDPRLKDGELLWPERFPLAAVEAMEAELGSYATAGQLQQLPSPEAGGILKREWFQMWKEQESPYIEMVVQSWDTAFSPNKNAAYSACTTWGVFYDENDVENVILLSMWRGRVEYVELRERAKRLYFDYRDVYKETPPNLRGRQVDEFLIEAQASGDPLIRDLLHAGIRAIPIHPQGMKDKVRRAQFVTPLIEGGRVWLPGRPPRYDNYLPYAEEFIEAAAAFPNAESNDLIDSMSQALIKLKRGMFLYSSRDTRPRAVHSEPIKY